MRSLCKAKHGTVLAVSGLVVAALLALASYFPRAAEAQAPPTTQPPPLAEPPVPPPELPRSAAHPQEAFRGMSIDQLLGQLTHLRAQRAALDRQEKEAVAALREKLKEQKQKLQQLGIALEEPLLVPSEALTPPPAKPAPPRDVAP